MSQAYFTIHAVSDFLLFIASILYKVQYFTDLSVSRRDPASAFYCANPHSSGQSRQTPLDY